MQPRWTLLALSALVVAILLSLAPAQPAQALTPRQAAATPTGTART